MGIAALLWNKPLIRLFFAGITPVIHLALAGSVLELAGHPTCPLSDTGFPLCYISLLRGYDAGSLSVRVKVRKQAVI